MGLRLYLFLQNAWYFNYLQDSFISKKIFNLSHVMFITADQGWVETLGPEATSLTVKKVSSSISARLNGLIINFCIFGLGGFAILCIN
jgi:hypothetical protein